MGGCPALEEREAIRSGSGRAASGAWLGPQEGAAFGYAVAGAGDVNGDGYDDVIVGAPFHDSGHEFAIAKVMGGNALRLLARVLE